MTDAFDELATQLHLELFAAFIDALGPEERCTQEQPDGVATVKGADGDLHELRRDTLRVVAAELGRLRDDPRPGPAAEHSGRVTELEPDAVWSGPHTQWTYGVRDPAGGTVIWLPMAESEARRHVARLREQAADGVRYAVLRTEIEATVEDEDGTDD